MSTEISVELIKLTPTLLWIGLIVAVLLAARAQMLLRVRDLTGLKLGPTGVEATFIVRELENAEKASATPAEKMATSSDRSVVARRAERNQEVLRGARLLWVDDNPNNNRYKISLFSALGITVDTALTTEDALNMISRHRYDVVITDMGRGDNSRAGIEFVEELRKQRNHPSIIVYTFGSGPVPNGAFGICERPDQLLHLVMDVLERERS